MHVRNLLLLGMAIRCLEGSRMQIKSAPDQARQPFFELEG
jgi:hypothetical protein